MARFLSDWGICWFNGQDFLVLFLAILELPFRLIYEHFRKRKTAGAAEPCCSSPSLSMYAGHCKAGSSVKTGQCFHSAGRSLLGSRVFEPTKNLVTGNVQAPTPLEANVMRHYRSSFLFFSFPFSSLFPFSPSITYCPSRQHFRRDVKLASKKYYILYTPHTVLVVRY